MTATQAVRSAWRSATSLNYFRLHVLYFVATTLLGSAALVGFEQGTLGWVDAWFTTVSAMTVTGLGVVDFPSLTLPSKSVVWVLICLGGQTVFALVPLILRKVKQNLVTCQPTKRGSGAAAPHPPDLHATPPGDGAAASLVHASEQAQQGIGAQNGQTQSDAEAIEQQPTDTGSEEKDCVTLLFRVYVVYGVVCTLFGFVSLAIYCSFSASAQAVLQSQGVGAVEFAAFTAVSGFNNAGFSVFSSSLVPFQDDAFVVLITCVLITAGNTLFPVFIRGSIVLLSKTRYGARRQALFKAVLDTPRSYTTHMFDRQSSLFLLGLWLVVTIFQFVLYTAVPFNAPVEDRLDYKALDMFFTTISTRTAGFNVIDLNALNPGILVLQVLLMYLSSYPFIVTIKTTTRTRAAVAAPNKVEGAQQSGAGDLEQQQVNPAPDLKVGGEVADRIKKTLSQDLVWLALGTWLIAIADPSLSIESLYRLIWEVTSAYGNVGLSLSTAADVASFSSSFTAFSKLVITAVMIAGRHRGMPLHLDAAIELIAVKQAPQKARLLIHSLPPGRRFHTIGHGREKEPKLKADVQSLFLA